jgi:drug/metabolite transporter (DMT)-like permease
MGAKKTHILASLELLTAAAFWGFGFVAAVWALKAFSALEVTLLRFLIASVIGLVFFLSQRTRKAVRENWDLSFWPAALLTGTLLFQTWGLQYTTATKSGFITTLYVVFVPLLEFIIQKRKLPLALWCCVVSALIGTALIVNLGLSDLNIGDLLTFICALLAAGQIYVLAVISPKVRTPFVFNIVQSYWALLICLPLLLVAPVKIPEWSAISWQALAGLGSLAIGSTVIAFYLQVRAQAHLSATVSSLFFLLESPFALLFAVLLLGESLGPLESMGAALIFLSAVAASGIEAKRKKF